MTKPVGYSGTPLVKKLGIKAGAVRHIVRPGATDRGRDEERGARFVRVSRFLILPFAVCIARFAFFRPGDFRALVQAFVQQAVSISQSE